MARRALKVGAARQKEMDVVNEAAPAAGLTAPATAVVPAPSSTASSAAAPAVVVNEAAPAAGLAAPDRGPQPC